MPIGELGEKARVGSKSERDIKKSWLWWEKESYGESEGIKWKLKENFRLRREPKWGWENVNKEIKWEKYKKWIYHWFNDNDKQLRR